MPSNTVLQSGSSPLAERDRLHAAITWLDEPLLTSAEGPLAGRTFTSRVAPSAWVSPSV